ncbi:MAG: phosphoribosylaminoimidazolesuccinocarboxamide synthase [Bryobacteraceae bacterium]|nr:phosphoribosylaminoimidazolesuccinocarboxamide synthase [Bryobacteraceae bacterium]
MRMPLLESELPGVVLRARGKVRDVYDVGEQTLIVASDRISAFDYILPVGIPRKGEVLTQLSLFWFNRFRHSVPNHVVCADPDQYPEELQPYRDQLQGRSMLVRRADMIGVECVARGYISGSGWKEYEDRGTVCGIDLPRGLRESDRLPEPIFTPATKAESGHDENISFERVEGMLGGDVASRLRALTLEIYNEAAKYAETRGIIIADTKFEFGFSGGKLLLADEVLTPDSSRFWPRDSWQPGGPQPSYDKQYVRDYLEEIRWNKQPPAPVLPDDVIQRTSDKYVEAFRLITGEEL